jgi:anti-anti-sigma regulatory factor
LAFELLKDAREWVFRLSGVVDVAEASTLLAAAREAARVAPPAVVVHLQEVDRLDTSATQILLALQGALAASGRVLRIESTPPAVAELWRRAGLGERLMR